MWERYPGRHPPTQGLGLVVSHDGGRNFAAPESVPDSADAAGGANGSYQGLLMKKLAINGAGTMAIVNSSLKQNVRSRVWMMRGQLAR